MSEEQAKFGAEAATGTEKPKRTRKRKNDTDAMSAQAFQVAADMQQSDMDLSSISNESIEADQTMVDSTDETIDEITVETEANPVALAAEHLAAEHLAADHLAADHLAEENLPSEPPAAVSIGSACGGQLKAAREALGLSIHEVSGQLRLGINQIQAIEQDDFAKLPQQSIVRGFIRNYARLLKVESEPILAAYQRLVPSEAPLPLSVKSNVNTSVIGKTQRPVRPQRYINLLIFLLLLAVLTYFYMNHIKPQSLKNVSQPLNAGNLSQSDASVELPPAPASVSVEDATKNNSSSITPTESPQQETSTVGIAANAPSPEISALNTAQASLPTAAMESTVISTPTPAANNTPMTTVKAVNPTKAELFFKVTEDSWIRIEDGQGNKVFSEVLTAGTERALTVEKPLNITVGHASGTKLTIDSQPYDLSQATRGRVARIQLK